MTTALKQSKSALHVEDDITWQETIGGYLQEAGFDVTQVDNQQDAENHAQRQPFDLYVFDGHFPLMRGGSDQNGYGLDLYDKIRGMRGEEIKCIIVSGSDLRRQCDQRGIAFMYKGRFDFVSFMAYLENVR